MQNRVSHYLSNSISQVPCLGFCSNEPGTALATLNKEF
ncbi:Catalase [Pseudomonas synxantha]|uniref:Catalase n=1 Tax=Pseudomonas synxantha TaxID=47883 RepID=A0AAU8TXL6_9PSED|nr:Catalase [Pseudomonas synxantha]AZE64306.1 Catalase [Pseudomonas synxantha]AZE75893.1 Catalase [Pseudomonas synxantha]